MGLAESPFGEAENEIAAKLRIGMKIGRRVDGIARRLSRRREAGIVDARPGNRRFGRVQALGALADADGHDTGVG